MTSNKSEPPEGSRAGLEAGHAGEVGKALCEATLNSQPVQLCVLDQQGTILMVNRAWDFAAGTTASVAGFRVGGSYPSALEHGRTPGDPYALEEAEGLASVLCGQREAFSIEYPKPDPLRTRWYLLSITPLVLDGRLAGAVLSRTDITARRRVEDELTTLYKAIDASIEGLALFSPQGKCQFMNAAFAHVHGYDASVELAAKEWEDLYPREEVARFEREVLPQLKRVGYWSGEMRCRLKGGGTFMGEVSFTLILRGEVIICSVRDISERKRAEAALERSESQLRAIFESARDVVFFKDASRIYLKANRALAESLQRPASGILGRTDEDLFDPEVAAEHRATDLRVLAGETVEQEKSKVVRGHERTYHVIKTPIRDGGGRIVGICGIARDTTERVLSERLMERRDLFLSKVADASRELLVNLDFPKAMNRALSLLGEAVNADRVYLYEIHRDVGSKERVLSQRFEWTSAWVTPQLANPAYHNIPLSHPLAVLWRPVLEETGWVRQVVSDLPEEHQTIFEANGARSLMVAPVHCGGELWGCVGFSDCRMERDWSRNEEWILSAFAAAIGGALQRKETERRMRESESRMRFLLDNTPGRIFYVHDRAYDFEYLSPNIEAVTGYSVEEMKGSVNGEGVGGPINEEAKKIFTRVVEEGYAPPPFRWQIRHRDGRILDFWCKESPVVERGEVTAVLGVMWPLEAGR